jgi:hypothetical protein
MSTLLKVRSHGVTVESAREGRESRLGRPHGPAAGRSALMRQDRRRDGAAGPNRVLKVEKVGANRAARFCSQHYLPGSAGSNLAKSLLNERVLWAYLGIESSMWPPSRRGCASTSIGTTSSSLHGLRTSARWSAISEAGSARFSRDQVEGFRDVGETKTDRLLPRRARGGSAHAPGSQRARGNHLGLRRSPV